MKAKNLRYLLVFLFTISIFHLTGAECDEDNNTVTGIDEAAIGQWVTVEIDTNTFHLVGSSENIKSSNDHINVSFEIDTTITYLDITPSKLSVWEKKSDEPCARYLFASTYSATGSSLTISNTNGGQQQVSYSVDGDNMTVIVPGIEGLKIVFDTLNFSRQTFSVNELMPYCISGIWKFISNDSIFIEVDDDEVYTKWKDTGSCYNFENSGLISINYSENSGSFNNYNQGSTADIYYNGNDTLIINPLSGINSLLEAKKIEIPLPDTCVRVTDTFIDFEVSQCQDD